MRFFTSEQADAVREHLGRVLLGHALNEAIATLDWVCAEASTTLSVPKDERRRLRAEEHSHRVSILKHAAALQRLLHAERPLFRTAGLDWRQFDEWLAMLTEAARVEADCSRPASTKGRPAEDWRDRLVAVAYGVFPDGDAAIAKDSRFEVLVGMLLEFLDREIEDVHGMVVDALRRQPKPHFRLTLKQPLRIIR
jgi:hypothetical protein